MKKIRVTVIYELEIPDEWEICDPSGVGLDDHLKFDSECYMPDMMWMKYLGKEADDRERWEGASDDVEDRIIDHIKCGVEHSIQYIDEFSCGDEVSEDD